MEEGRNISFTPNPDNGAKDMEDNLYALFGNPVSHSLSPFIHSLFAKQTHQKMTYSTIHVERDCLATALDNFQAHHGKGMNITAPFKQEAFFLVDSCNDRAKQAQAINTIFFDKKGQRVGDNTDGVGLIRDLMLRQKISIRNKRLLIIGAGGAVRGVLGPLLAEQPAEVIIANRTEGKAQQLAKEFGSLGSIQTRSFDKLMQKDFFDLVINATSINIRKKEILPLHHTLLKNAFCYDMSYSPSETAFIKQAKNQGAIAHCDGLGMLIEQAAESFYLWHGVRPDTQITFATVCNIDT